MDRRIGDKVKVRSLEEQIRRREGQICDNKYYSKEDKAKYIDDNKITLPLAKTESKQALFYLKKTLFTNNTTGYKLIGWKNILKLSELPEEYFEEFPYFYETEGTISLRGNSALQLPWYLEKGDIISCIRWGTEILPELKKAGDRLTKINRKERWNGEVVVKI